MMGTLAGRSHGDAVACRAVQTGREAPPGAACARDGDRGKS